MMLLMVQNSLQFPRRGKFQEYFQKEQSLYHPHTTTVEIHSSPAGVEENARPVTHPSWRIH